MKIDITIKELGKSEKRNDTEKHLYQINFKTYNSEISGKFEKSEIRHIIQQLDNAI